ncbi:MAG: FAD-binding oxidoreductase, partial [Flavobacteriales bacterium]|nr:FAD-binding oxidoreductase [Flavobacteriales bacterium]
MSGSPVHDVIVIGRGIAGVLLSEELRERGLDVLVVDLPRPGRASAVAAGVVNPVVLRRTVPSWRAASMLPFAGERYHELETRLNVCCWHPTPLFRVFPGGKEREDWIHWKDDPEVCSFLGHPSDEVPDGTSAPFGVGPVLGAAWLDVPALLDAHRKAWSAEGLLIEQEVGPADVGRSAAEVEVLGRRARLIVHTTGPFAEVPGLSRVRGEGLTVRVPGLQLPGIMHRGVFLLPQGGDLFRVGATFAWDQVWSGPTEQGRAWLEERLKQMLTLPYEVVDHWAGVRPASRDRRPILGRIAPHEAVLNGLGSRGV